MNKYASIVILGAVAGLSVAACGGSQPATVTIHGSVANDVSAAAPYPAACAFGKPASGNQIVITSPSGTVISTATLGTLIHAANPSGHFTCTLPFTATKVPQETRYGFTINGVPGTIWMTNISGTVQLNVSAGNG